MEQSRTRGVAGKRVACKAERVVCIQMGVSTHERGRGTANEPHTHNHTASHIHHSHARIHAHTRTCTHDPTNKRARACAHRLMGCMCKSTSNRTYHSTHRTWHEKQQSSPFALLSAALAALRRWGGVR